MLRRKNRLMHAGHVEEANVLARLIRTVITRRDTAWLRKVDTRTCARAAWTSSSCVTSLEAEKDMEVKSSMESRRKDLTTTTPLSQLITTTVPLHGKCRHRTSSCTRQSQSLKSFACSTAFSLQPLD